MDQFLCELMVSRLCHDLASPAGALSNGLELLEEGGAVEGDVLDFMGSSSDRILASIKFFRFALGYGGRESAAVQEILDAVKDYGASHEVSFISKDSEGEHLLPWNLAKSYLLIGGALVAMTSRGQSVVYNITKDQDYRLSCTFIGDMAQIPDNLEKFRLIQTSQNYTNATSRTIFSYLAVRAFSDVNPQTKYEIDVGEKSITISTPL